MAAPSRCLAWGSLLLIDAAPAEASWAVGPTFRMLPKSVNASGVSSELLPGFDYDAPSGVFVSTDDSIGWNLSARSDIQAGVRLWPQFGRSASEVPVGVGPIGTRVQTELFGNVQVLPALLLQSGFSHGAGLDHAGNQLELGATSGFYVGRDLLGIGLASTYANRAFRNGYFGISPEVARASGLNIWSAGNGWQDVSVALSTEHQFDPHWKLDAQLMAAKLLGAAARSPLTLHRGQRGATLSLWYGF